MAAVQTVDATTLKQWIDKDEVLLIDVREANEHARAHIPEAILVPLSRLGAVELPEAGGRKVAVICASGARSGVAADRLLCQHYNKVYNVYGGMMGWRMAGFQTVRDESAPSGPLSGLFSLFRQTG